MTKARIFQPKSTATDLYVALELSRSSWVVAVQRSGQIRPAIHKLIAGDIEGLLAVVARARLAEAQAGRILVCYEIGYDGFWLARDLVARGWVFAS